MTLRLLVILLGLAVVSDAFFWGWHYEHQNNRKDKNKGKVSRWGAWSSCNAPCGQVGTMTRTRTCIEAPCSVSLTETTRCKNKCSGSRPFLCGPTEPCAMIGSPGTCYRYKTKTDACKPTGRRSCSAMVENICVCGQCPRFRKEYQSCPCPPSQNWGRWSACSSTCGPATQERKRACTPREPGCSITGIQTEVQACTRNPQCPVWGEWTDGPCNCPAGFALSTRKCGYPTSNRLGWKTVNPKYCEGDSQKQIKCATKCPEWMPSGPPTPCSKTCGPGIQTQEFKCFEFSTGVAKETHKRNCNGRKNSVVTQCDLGPCPGKWGEWSQCSATCGMGIKTRERGCIACPGNKEVEKATCEIISCPVWSDYKFKPCSVTCGGGKQTGENSCIHKIGNKVKVLNDNACPPNPTKIITQDCNLFNCPEWINDGPPSECSVTCGDGITKQKRNCMEYSSGYPQKVDPRQCPGGKKQNILNSPCNLGGCPGVWGKYGTCTKSCGGGEKTRTRVCPSCPGNIETETVPCNEHDCPTWTDYKYDECSKTCGVGTQNGVKKCVKVSGKKNIVVDDSECPLIIKSIIRKCNVFKCPEWVNHGPPTECSKTCGDGTTQQTRKCMEYSSGSAEETAPTMCVGGKRERILESPCNLGGCPGVWGDYSACTATCGGGKKTRTRVCPTCPGGSESETTDCNEHSCPAWGNWEEETCSVTCGEGKTVQTRKCYTTHTKKKVEVDPGQCDGVSIERIYCNKGKCPEWTPWSKFGKCSSTCQKKRSRDCMANGKVVDDKICEGEAEESVPCEESICKVVLEECSKTCGGGIQKQYTVCSKPDIHSCDDNTKYIGCNAQPCNEAPVSCSAPDAKRYKQNKCCKSERETVTYKDIDTNQLITQECGKPTHDYGVTSYDARIIGGYSVKSKTAWPWMALYISPSVCGATVINNKFLITAAHCAHSGGRLKDFSQAYVRTSLLNWDDREDNAGGHKHSLKNVFVHEKYVFPIFDIALLQTKYAMPDRVMPACLPNGQIIPDEARCFAMGWGLTIHSGNSAAKKLMEVELTVFPKDFCQRVWIKDKNENVRSYVDPANTQYDGKWICAGSLWDNRDTCRGDSGGPLICQRCKTCNWVISGLTSFGPSHCGLIGHPGVYSSVEGFDEWIRKKAQIEQPSEKMTCDNPSASMANVWNFFNW